MSKIKTSLVFISLMASMSIQANADSVDESPEQVNPEQSSPRQSNLVLEEVVVSALREVSVREIDGSISLLGQATLDSLPAQHFQDLFQQIPNMNLSGEGSRARYFQLRGIGELEQYEGAPNPSVGFIFDDIDLSGVGGITSLFDIQRIEVLRGPQATRFGANAIGGLVYVQSIDPHSDPELKSQISAGNDGTREISFAMGGSLGKATTGRFSVQQQRSDGFYENLSQGRNDSNGRDELLAHGKVLWDLDNGWEAKLSLLFADFDNGYDAWTPDNGTTTHSNNPGRDEQETLGLSARVSGPVNNGIDFVSISAFADSDILFSYDGEWGDAELWSPYVYDYVYQDQRQRKTLSQEFRLLSTPSSRLFNGRSDWLVGIYAQRLDESNHIISSGIYDDSADAPFSYCAPCIDRNSLDSEYQSDNFAIFGKLDTALGEHLTFSTGVRFEHWQSDYKDTFTDEIYGDPDAPVQHVFSPSERLWGGDISLNFELSERVSVYGLVSRGYKAGGFNPSLARAIGVSQAAGPAAIVFQPEVLWNYEAGVKGIWLDGQLHGEFSVFFMNREEMQIRSSAQYTDNPNDFIFVTSNAQGHSRGLEANLNWQLTNMWTLHGTVGLLDSEIDDYGLEREADITTELIGREFAHAPAYTMNLGVSFNGQEQGQGRWIGRLDFNALGSFYFDYSHDEKASSRRLVNFKLGRQWDQWEIYAWVRNLLNEEYHTRGFSFGLSPPLFSRTRFTRLGDPRHFGLTLAYRH